GAGGRGDARADVDGDAADIIRRLFDLAGVQPRAGGKAECARTVADRERAMDRTRGAVESREETIAGGVHFVAAKTRQLLAHEGMVAGEPYAPGAVAEPRRGLGRTDDVGEQHGSEHAIDVGNGPHAGQELLDLIENGILVADPGQMIGAGELDQPRAGNVPRE